MNKNGVSQYDLARSAYQATGREGKSLRNKPTIDPLLAHIFEWFEGLSRSRFNYVGMDFAFAPLQPTEIEAYMRLKQVTPHPVEFDLLNAVDSIFLELMNKRDEKK